MHTPRHPTRSITIMASALLALFLLSFVLGRYGVPLGEVVKILLSRVFPIEQTWTDNMAIAVWNVRLPRILLACLVGCGLSAAGTAYQTVFQNPMAAPDILGASSGACFGAALLFGAAGALGPALQSVGVSEGYYLFYAAPYVLTLGVLIATSSPTRAMTGAPGELSITK